MSVAKLDWYAWCPADFRKDTQHLTRDERNAYRDLIDEIFVTNQAGASLPDDDWYLSRVVGHDLETWKTMRHAIIDGAKPLLIKKRKRLYSKRLGEEIDKAKEKSEKARRAVEERERKRSSNDDPSVIERSSIESKTREEKKINFPSGSRKKKNPSDSKKKERIGGMTIPQFIYKRDEIQKWFEEKREIYLGDDGSGIRDAFERKYKMPLSQWEELEREYAAMPN